MHILKISKKESNKQIIKTPPISILASFIKVQIKHLFLTSRKYGTKLQTILKQEIVTKGLWPPRIVPSQESDFLGQILSCEWLKLTKTKKSTASGSLCTLI